MPVMDVVGELVEFSHAPGGERGPAARSDGGGGVVELLRVAQEEEDEQEGEQEGRQRQVHERHSPAQMGF